MITTTARLDLRNDDVAKILISLKSNENHPKVQKLPSIKEFISYQEYPGHSIKSKHFHLATTLNQKTHLTFISNNDLYSKDLAHDHLYRLPTVTKCDPFVGRSTVALPVSYQKLNVKSLESNFTPSISQTLSKAADLVVNPVSLENSVVGDTNSPSTKFSKKRKACEVHSPGHDSKYGTDSDNQKSPASSSTGYDEDIPRRQALRFPEDQYTPKWVRYSGPKREGLCELCTYGKWLQLKDSAFWYHKQFFHGISSTSGLPFTSPLEYRSIWNGDGSDETGLTISISTEGLCHHCNEWIPLFKNKKRLSTYYPDLDRAKQVFLEERSGLKFQPKLISTNPLKILVGRQENNEPFIPASVVVSNSILLDLKRNENGKLSGVWWKHTHACHQYTSQF